MEIKMIEVKSSCINSIGYDEFLEELYVEFKNGGIYRYPHCSKPMYDRLMVSPSKGRFINDHFVGEIHYDRIN
jgi:hypothetical protein